MTGSTKRGWALMALVTAGVVVSGAARAADDGYANVFTSLFTAVGVLKPDRPPEISYRERAPLVIPPQPGLPKPADSIKRTAGWPQDPDVVRRRREAEDAKAPRFSTGEHAEILSPAELAKGRAEADPARRDSCLGNGNSQRCLLVSPDALKAMGDRYAETNPDKSTTLEAGKEPDRMYLTQPPKGYMRATKTVKATTEAPHVVVDQADPRTFQSSPKHEDE